MLPTRTNPKRHIYLKLLIPFLLLLSASLACNVPVSRLLGQQDQGKPPAQAPQQPAEGKKSEDTGEVIPPSNTAQPDTPTFTLSPTASLTPTTTPTPTPYVVISQNTNCRYGPDSIYDLLHTYLSGDEAILLGKNAAESFWYTKSSSGNYPDCWLWGKFATPVGDTAALPVFTPPPTPTPYMDFTASFGGADCGAGSCWLWIKVDNTGVLPLESVKVYAKDTMTSADSTFVSNLFQTGIMGSDIANVPLSGFGYTHSGQLPNPSGHTVNVNVKVCTQNGLNGMCVTKSLVVNP